MNRNIYQDKHTFCRFGILVTCTMLVEGVSSQASVLNGAETIVSVGLISWWIGISTLIKIARLIRMDASVRLSFAITRQKATQR